MQRFFETLADWTAQAPAVLVRVQQLHGSGPREPGAMMAVSAAQTLGTIGGGQLEFQAIACARAALRDGRMLAEVQRHALGPALGQCCGGVVRLVFETVAPGAAWPAQVAQALRNGHEARLPSALFAQTIKPEPFHITLFGGGHVGRAIVALLGTLPCRVSWVDSRDEVFPAELPHNVRCEHSAPVQAAVNDLHGVPAGSHVLIMSFSHAEDLDIVRACLARQRVRGDLAFIGLIGSKTKWTAFRHRLEERGFRADEIAQVTCPIGVAGVQGKEPQVIALAACAQLFQLRDAALRRQQAANTLESI
jgi:xanthine dehydrogenase accessory factor